MYPLDFLKTECATEVELHIERRTRVVGKLLLRVLVELQSVLGQAETAVPIHSLLLPVLEPLYVGARLHEELHLHLLELARPENEVAGRNLIPERLADLRDAERNLLPRRLLDVKKIHVNPLSGLRPQIDDGRGVFDGTHEGLEHQIE